jgi:hypothetical protein
MSFRQYRRASSGSDAAIQTLVYWLVIITAPIWVPALLIVIIYQQCSSNTPAVRAERARIQAEKVASQAREQQRQEAAISVAAHEPWDALRCEALFVRLDRAVRSAHQGNDAGAVEANSPREQETDHGCKRPLSLLAGYRRTRRHHPP